MGQEPLTLTVREAAKLLGISRNTAYEAIARGEIPSVRLGKRLIVPRHQLMQLLGEPDPSQVSAQLDAIRENLELYLREKLEEEAASAERIKVKEEH